MGLCRDQEGAPTEETTSTYNMSSGKSTANTRMAVVPLTFVKNYKNTYPMKTILKHQNPFRVIRVICAFRDSDRCRSNPRESCRISYAECQ